MISLMRVLNADSNDLLYINLKYVIAIHAYTIDATTEGTEIQMIDEITYRVKHSTNQISEYWESLVSGKNNQSSFNGEHA
jgi:hypothetical protein